MTQAEKDAVWCEWALADLHAHAGFLLDTGTIELPEYRRIAAQPPTYNTETFWLPELGPKPSALLVHPSLCLAGRFSKGEIYLAEKRHAQQVVCPVI